ncbi:hypothetical protein M9H77_29411 [Catharanthus roseus]|uniref:Uncharacterized protein n=1 Tax=Catharanthus roseus TaxID=4058 RepID=A0ACB9ZUP2_CATRO|nr:hypothetical protein M9H77_29411 [Catharanthus roseus]
MEEEAGSNQLAPERCRKVPFINWEEIEIREALQEEYQILAHEIDMGRSRWIESSIPCPNLQQPWQYCGKSILKEASHKEGELLDPDPSPRLYSHPFLVSSINHGSYFHYEQRTKALKSLPFGVESSFPAKEKHQNSHDKALQGPFERWIMKTISSCLREETEAPK